MTATISKDEDLIILSSDTNEDIFNFWDNVNKELETKVEDNSWVDSIIDFWSDLGFTNETSQEKVEEIQTPEVNFDFSFDSDNSQTSDSSSDLEISWVTESIDLWTNEIPKTDLVSDEFSFWEVQEEVSSSLQNTNDDFFSQTSNVSSSEDLWDTNTILDQTIAKLTSRKDIIKSKKDEKSQSVKSLQEQIKELESQVANLNEEITWLDLESKKIEKNISWIEKMKLDTDLIERPQRQHNLDNIKKAK